MKDQQKNNIALTKVIQENKCCGCSACYNICPVSSISMVENRKGFLEPQINEILCIHCGKCVEVCPSLNKKENSNWRSPKKYAFAASKALRSKSSSGGAFSLLAEHVLNKDGLVAGAAYMDDNISVHHILIDDKEQLDVLRLSKYVQSVQEDNYKKVQKLLKEGKTVLYTGTPCQIAGLKSFLNGTPQTNLYTVDVLCHGVPPAKLLREHLQNMFGIETIQKIAMRRSDTWAVCLDIYFKDGSCSCHKEKGSIFIAAFLNDMILRDCCYNCKYASLPRQGDITIGDLWSARELKLGLPYEEKSSIVLVNNKEGEYLWQHVLATATDYDCQGLNKQSITALNSNIYTPNATYNEKSDIFWKKYLQQKITFEEAVFQTLYPQSKLSYREIVPNKEPALNVGLVLYASDNYGSCATNIAIYKAIENLGYTPIVLDSIVSPWGVSKKYIDKHLRISSPFIAQEDYQAANSICDTFVLGSDYSLNITAPHTVNNIEKFLMAFVDDGKRKIAYAPSLGMPDVKNDLSTRYLYTVLLQRFNCISFREDSAVDLCKKYFDIDAYCVLDPVFLVNEEIYGDIASESSLRFNEKFLLAYILDPTPEKKELIKKAAQSLNLPYYIIIDCEGYESFQKDFTSEDHLFEKPSFEDWLSCFIHSSYIITDSFHGTCFALILKKPFISLKNRNTKRFDSLAKLLGYEFNSYNVQIFNSLEEVNNQKIYFKELNFLSFDKILTKQKEYCLDFLKNALKSDTNIIKKSNLLEFSYIWKELFYKKEELWRIKEINSVPPKRNFTIFLKEFAIYIIRESCFTPAINKILPLHSRRRNYVKNIIKRIIQKFK